MRALEARVRDGLTIDTVTSVASFFVSRVDTEVDERLRAHGGPLRDLQGKAAIAGAQLAYAAFVENSRSARWRALEAKGAKPQRLLWASTATKNPAYSDVVYVESLIRAQSIATIPLDTLDLFEQHEESLTRSATARLAMRVGSSRHWRRVESTSETSPASWSMRASPSSRRLSPRACRDRRKARGATGDLTHGRRPIESGVHGRRGRVRLGGSVVGRLGVIARALSAQPQRVARELGTAVWPGPKAERHQRATTLTQRRQGPTGRPRRTMIGSQLHGFQRIGWRHRHVEGAVARRTRQRRRCASRCASPALPNTRRVQTWGLGVSCRGSWPASPDVHA